MANDTKQFVSFYLGKEKYGIDIDLVQEIIRMPELTKAPLAPPYVEGLANLRGTILTVVNGRLRFGLERREFDDSSRVIIIDYGGRKLGFIVDRVSDVVTVSSGDIEKKETGQGEFVDAVAKTGDGELVLVVSTAKLFPRIQKKPGQGSRTVEKRVQDKAEEKEGERQLVSFRLGSEEYALDIMDVQEIVHLPESISQMPGAPMYCEGLATLRGRLLPLVRLGSLLGLDGEVLDDRCRVVVVNITTDIGRITAGFAVDGVSEVLRVSRECIEPVPSMLKSNGTGFISGICNLSSERLVKILDARRLFNESDYEVLFTEDTGEVSMDKHTDTGDEDDQYVTFMLAGEEYGAPIAQVQEIIRVPRIFAVPRAPEFVEGVVNIRGQVTPVVDLRKRFGLETSGRNESSRIIVVDIDSTRTGLVVDAVREVLKLSRRDVDQIPEIFLEADETGFLSGIGKVRKGERILILLDFMRLLSKKERDELRDLGSEADQGAGS